MITGLIREKSKSIPYSPIIHYPSTPKLHLLSDKSGTKTELLMNNAPD